MPIETLAIIFGFTAAALLLLLVIALATGAATKNQLRAVRFDRDRWHQNAIDYSERLERAVARAQAAEREAARLRATERSVPPHRGGVIPAGTAVPNILRPSAPSMRDGRGAPLRDEPHRSRRPDSSTDVASDMAAFQALQMGASALPAPPVSAPTSYSPPACAAPSSSGGSDSFSSGGSDSGSSGGSCD